MLKETTAEQSEQNRNVQYPKFLPLGDQVIVAQFEKEITINVNQKVLSFAQEVDTINISGVTQIIPTFCTVAIRYNPLIITYKALTEELDRIKGHIIINQYKDHKSKNIIHIPVVYGGKYGSDIEYVAENTGLDIDEVIRLHTSKPYFIYMLGVIGSYPYLGDLDERLALKRRSSPRIKVEKGSIVIANRLTVLHPLASPSGWHVIGQTPMETFNPYQNPPSTLLAGDYIKFEAISVEEAEQWNDNKQREWIEKWNSLKSLNQD